MNFLKRVHEISHAELGNFFCKKAVLGWRTMGQTYIPWNHFISTIRQDHEQMLSDVGLFFSSILSTLKNCGIFNGLGHFNSFLRVISQKVFYGFISYLR